MDKILVIDLVFLVVFLVVVALFLSKNRNKLSREGLIYLYRTKLGMRAIDTFSTKFSKQIKNLKYIVISVAFLLMVFIILLLSTNAYAYINSPLEIMKATNGAPPIAPLIPYFPQIFGMESFFPNFYFSYFIIALAIVAIVHEFAHGVFMKTFGVRIKSTGFLFLGPILGAFVEEDKNNLEKKSNSEQMAILGAGVFANISTALVFFFVLILFFNAFYVPSGYVFSGYPQTIINMSSIDKFENYSNNLVLINSNNQEYFIPQDLYKTILEGIDLGDHLILAYDNYPAMRSDLRGSIIELDGKRVTDQISFQKELMKRLPGDYVFIKTIYNGSELYFNISLESHPDNSSKPFLGVTNLNLKKNGIKSFIISLLTFKDPSTFYIPRFNEDITEFFYYLIWWIALINLFVALFNMLPIGILDGGRFSFLLINSFIKSEKKSRKIYNLIMSTVGIIFLLIIFAWIFAKFIR